MWMSVTETMNSFGGKLTDACPKVKCKYRSCGKRKDYYEVTSRENQALNSIFQQKWRWFYELEIGDPSRNVIEKIFRAASTNPSTQHRTIKKVLRVNNTVDISEKFEKYRGAVKRRSFGQHPRSTVDGNELLQFYVTTMTCCYGKRKIISDLCKDPSCCVCKLIQTCFRNSCNSENGIQLSTSSDAPCEHASRVSNTKNVKRAVIVCRTIAGRVVNKDDMKLDQEYDSVASGLHSRSQYLIVKDSDAVLPCFIIVLN
ncbi:uncharacterized protein LOC132029697 [Lycium ferocissimum]|uniref:uncharacterized protein LOC132029697 n=1 Tax=Lycium ferocissimum TaxID=112874 RepID=UPI0028156D7F|nr:uncharacterized protein LOC132029697 [Lycium ferocissimum]